MASSSESSDDSQDEKENDQSRCAKYLTDLMKSGGLKA